MLVRGRWLAAACAAMVFVGTSAQAQVRYIGYTHSCFGRVSGCGAALVSSNVQSVTLGGNSSYGSGLFHSALFDEDNDWSANPGLQHASLVSNGLPSLLGAQSVTTPTPNMGGNGQDNGQINAQVTTLVNPEPESLAMLATGLVGLVGAVVVRRRHPAR